MFHETEREILRESYIIVLIKNIQLTSGNDQNILRRFVAGREIVLY